MTESNNEVMAAEAARVQAEARRKRILDKANKRLGVVSGEQAQATEENEGSLSKAARIRAARQRRYGRKDIETATTVDDSKKEEPNEAFSTADPPEELALTQVSSATKENLDEGSLEIDQKQEDPPVNHKSTTKEESVVEGGGDSIKEPKKKYLGVARMRRQMIKNKKTVDNLAPVDDSFGAGAAVKVHVEPPLSSLDPLKVRVLPIYMHILTIFLLFFAGIDISCQQAHRNIQVYSELAIRKYGIALIHRSIGSPLRDQNSESTILRDFQVPSDINQISNEFQDDDVDSAQNIDPLFRVDLDELTKGPGVIKSLARGAVSVHRSIVLLVYLFPLSVVQASLRVPQALLRSPPTLCLVALAVRHLLGKAILGAGIPEPSKESEKGPIDVLAMAKNFVINFMSANFPTAVGLYGAFTHLRTDMYVLLCGVFSGFVWLHMRSVHPFLPVSIVDEQSAYQEL